MFRTRVAAHASVTVISLSRRALTLSLVLLAVCASVATPLWLPGRVSMVSAISTSIWPDTTVPATKDSQDGQPVELGIRLTSSQSGSITGIRFYKSAGNTGSHVGTLWDGGGRSLARATFAGETSSGWQSVTFASAIPVQADVVYVASYSTTVGHYADDEQVFGNERTVSNGPLTALSGVYRYPMGFPTNTWNASNYYVDVAFSTTSSSTSSTTQATPISATPTRIQKRSWKTRVPRTATSTTTSATSTTTSATTPAAEQTPSTTSIPPVVNTATTGCAARPSSCGYPDQTNTGVPSGTTLRRVPEDVTQGPGWHYDQRGWVTIDGEGATFAGYRVNANVDVTAHNVTVKNNEIVPGNGNWGVSLRHASGAVIDRNTIRGTAISALCDNAIRDIYGDSDQVQLTGNHIYYCASGINHFNVGGLIRGNYIHDLGQPCPGNDPDCGHYNGIQLGAGNGPLMTIDNNTIFVPAPLTDCIMLANDDGAQTNRTITNNLLAGGGYTFYGSGGPAGQATNIVFKNNKFSTLYFPRSGSYGPVAHWQNSAGNVWSGNTWADGPNAGLAVNP